MKLSHYHSLLGFLSLILAHLETGYRALAFSIFAIVNLIFSVLYSSSKK